MYTIVFVISYKLKNNIIYIYILLNLFIQTNNYGTFTTFNLFFFKNSINFKLINGLNYIHPVGLITSYTLISLLCSNTVQRLLLYIKFENHHPITSRFNPLYIFFFTLVLGSWWAQQELNWGGWWGWDFIEVFLLVFSIYYTLLHHYSKNKFFNYTKTILDITLCFLFFTYLTRTNFIVSIHTFIDELKFNQHIYSLILIIIAYTYYCRKKLLIFKRFSGIFNTKSNYWIQIINNWVCLLLLLIVANLVNTLFFGKNLIVFSAFFTINFILFFILFWTGFIKNHYTYFIGVFLPFILSFYEYIYIYIFIYFKQLFFKKYLLTHWIIFTLIFYLILYSPLIYSILRVNSSFFFNFKIENLTFQKTNWAGIPAITAYFEMFTKTTTQQSLNINYGALLWLQQFKLYNFTDLNNLLQIEFIAAFLVFFIFFIFFWNRKIIFSLKPKFYLKF